MAVNVSVRYNGGLFPDIILLNQCYYHEEVLFLQPTILPKHFDIFPPDWGMLRRSRRVQIFLYKTAVCCTSYSSIALSDHVLRVALELTMFKACA